MRARIVTMSRPARNTIVQIAIRLCAACATLVSGCATERNSQMSRPARSATAMTRLQSPEADSPGRDPALARTARSVQEPFPLGAPAELAEASGRLAAATRQGDLRVPVPSPPVVPPPLGEYPIDLSTALRLAEAENPTIAAARARIIEALALQTARGHCSCRRSIPAPTITFTPATSSARPARSSTSPINHSTLAEVPAPWLPARFPYR